MHHRLVQRRRNPLCYVHSRWFCARLHSTLPPKVTDLVEKHAAIPPRPLNLATLLSFGRPLSAGSLLDSVSYTLAEIPRRLATRVRSLEALPFIVGTNPFIANTLQSYRESFYWLATYPTVSNLQENAQFVIKLQQLVQHHSNDVATMAKGFQECTRYISSNQISDFLDGTIRNRISVRLIAEQHIALSQALGHPTADPIGVVDPKCSPHNMIELCTSFVRQLCEATLGSCPEVRIDGDTQSTFPYVPVHLEYILTELLKNSFRATVEHYQRERSKGSLPPIVITLSPPQANPRGEATYFAIRIRDQGGGISASNMPSIFTYAYTTAGRRVGEDGQLGFDDSRGVPVNPFAEISGQAVQTGLGTIAGLGYGLPMSRLYANYFGGSLELISLEGWGCDVFLKLRCLDEVEDSPI